MRNLEVKLQIFSISFWGYHVGN